MRVLMNIVASPQPMCQFSHKIGEKHRIHHCLAVYMDSSMIGMVV